MNDYGMTIIAGDGNRNPPSFRKTESDVAR